MHFDLQPALENDLLILRPLREKDFENLYSVASDPLIWEQHPAKERSRRDGFELFFKEAIASGGAFAVIDKKTGEIIGSTRFHAVKETQNAIEIRWTFLARKYWGGYCNQSMKTLMMDYAFNLVENVIFCVNENNIRSQKAIEKIGGKRTGQVENQPLELRTNAAIAYIIQKNQRNSE
jgi:RimJ/RimL family protein N-acetyltransferase